MYAGYGANIKLGCGLFEIVYPRLANVRGQSEAERIVAANNHVHDWAYRRFLPVAENTFQKEYS